MHRGSALFDLVRLALVLLIFSTSKVLAQECPHESPNRPSTASQIQTLEGRLIYHDGIRQWFELILDRPQCGQSSVQLISSDRKYEALEVLRGCRVRSSGAIDDSPTGYYSLDIFEDVETIRPVGECLQKLPFPDYSSASPDKRIQAYRVNMHVDYRPGDHPIEFHVRSGGGELSPWQAYASYMLTGGFVLYGFCAEGFVVDTVFGTPAAHPMHFDDPRTPGDMAYFDPEGSAAAGISDLHLGYTCIRHIGHN